MRFSPQFGAQISVPGIIVYKKPHESTEKENIIRETDTNYYNIK